jgi:hypothetical protein
MTLLLLLPTHNFSPPLARRAPLFTFADGGAKAAQAEENKGPQAAAPQEGQRGARSKSREQLEELSGLLSGGQAVASPKHFPRDGLNPLFFVVPHLLLPLF